MESEFFVKMFDRHDDNRNFLTPSILSELNFVGTDILLCTFFFFTFCDLIANAFSNKMVEFRGDCTLYSRSA